MRGPWVAVALILVTSAPVGGSSTQVLDLYAVQTVGYPIDTGSPGNCMFCLIFHPGPTMATYGREAPPVRSLPPGEYYFQATSTESCHYDHPSARLVPDGGVWSFPVFVHRTYPILNLPPLVEDYTGTSVPILLQGACELQSGWDSFDMLVLPLGTLPQGITAELTVALRAGGSASDVDEFPGVTG